MKHILAAIDLSDISSAVVEQASQLARSFGARLWLLHVVAPDPDFVGYEAGPQTVRDSVATELRDEHRRVQEIADKLIESGIDVMPRTVPGPTVETVLREADEHEIDTIVMGTHGHGALYRALLGSVSEGVMRKTRVPLLLIPATDKSI
jgi:nucleotide-binding universal stress UspA family protein